MNVTRYDLAAEQQALRFALGLPTEPVFLDIKPVGLLTVGERRRFAERLAEIMRQKDESARVSWWRRWRRAAR